MFNQVNSESNRSQIGFYCLEDLVPENHLLRQIESSIDFSFIYDILEDTYNLITCRPSVDPVMLVKTSNLLAFDLCIKPLKILKLIPSIDGSLV